jgi:hypothetical protein
MKFREKPHTNKYKGITNDSNYVICTPTSSLRHLRINFCCTGCTYDYVLFVKMCVAFIHIHKLRWVVNTFIFDELFRQT